VTKRQPRAVLYARLSKDYAKTGAGVERQLEDARKLAELRGFVTVAEHVDNDISAAGGKRRPAFEAMLADVTEGRADTVVAWAWDRLSRNRRDTLRLIEVGQQAQATVALVRGNDIDMTSASGRLVADLLAGVARAEIDAKSERQERAGLQRAEAGRSPSRRAFGYQQDGTPHPVEAPVVANLFSMFLAGATMAGLAKQLNKDGHTSTRGKQWDDTGVRVILTNPRYVAERFYRGERVAAGDWQPLVSIEAFEAVKAKLNDPGRKTRRPARKHLGGGLFLCHCGAKTKVSYDGGGVRVYICSASKHMQRKADPVDALVCDVIAARLRALDLKKLSTTIDDNVVADLRSQALNCRERMDSLAQDYADGLLTARQVQVATTRLKATLGDVEAKLADAGKGSAFASIAGAKDLADAWQKLPLDRQRAVLGALCDVVILPSKRGRGFDPETVRFDWRTP
jgi:site-specific DNA recombinase